MSPSTPNRTSVFWGEISSCKVRAKASFNTETTLGSNRSICSLSSRMLVPADRAMTLNSFSNLPAMSNALTPIEPVDPSTAKRFMGCLALPNVCNSKGKGPKRENYPVDPTSRRAQG